MASNSIRIAMLNTDMPVPNVRAQMGTYGAIFHNILTEAASRIAPSIIVESSDFDVVLGEYPESVLDFDAILVTGSAASSYDDAEWIHKLDDYILEVYQTYPSIKMFGSCFGHQLICQSLFRSLGGWVEKDPSGWEIGVQKLRLTHEFYAAFKPLDTFNDIPVDDRPMTPAYTEHSSRSLRLQVVHADHVRLPPPSGSVPASWMVVGSTDHCAVHGVYEPGRVLTFQGHFEFNNFVNTETVKAFGALWDTKVLEKALKSIDAEDDADRAAEIVVRFLIDR
jgi:GMP synthase-like glutamine amidotransferase